MAKGQKRGNRELRKPKQKKPVKETVPAMGSVTPFKSVTPSAGKK